MHGCRKRSRGLTGLVGGVVDLLPLSSHASVCVHNLHSVSEMAPTSGRLAVISVLKTIAGARYGFIL